jgi:hypothetical protein
MQIYDLKITIHATLTSLFQIKLYNEKDVPRIRGNCV